MFRAPESQFDAASRQKVGAATASSRIDTPPSGSPAPAAPSEYPAFDWLRLVLASGVFWVHSGSGQAISLPGDLFVQIFFALSGFLIGGIILRMAPGDLPRFFYNRTIRIWLPFFAAVGILYLAAYLKEGSSPLFWQSLAYDLTFTHNLFIEKTPDVITAMPLNGTGSHFWSISVEEQFYLIAPLLILFLPLAKTWIGWAVIAVAATLFGTWYGSVSAGVLAAMLHRRFGNWHLNPIAMLALLGVGGFLMLGWAHDWVDYRHTVPVLSVIVVLMCARPGTRSPMSEWVGGISFPMYLNHWIGLFVAGAIAGRLSGLGVLAADLLGFALSIGVAALAYRMIDRNLYTHRDAWYRPALGYLSLISVYALMALGLVLGLSLLGPLTEDPTLPEAA